jgi:hypothetical protein
LKRKIKSIIILFLLISTTCTGLMAQSTIEKQTDITNQSGLPDLILNVSFIKNENNGYYYYRMTVTNIGDAPAVPEDNFTFKVTGYPFGIYHLYDAICYILWHLPYHLYIAVSIFLVTKLHIWPLFCVESVTTLDQPLNPGDSYTRTCVFPVDQEADDFINAKLCIVTEAIVDVDDTIKESNERNNKKVIRWWLPNIMNPPKP